MEQVAIAAIDTRALKLAADLIKSIKEKFPDSERSTRLAVSTSSALSMCTCDAASCRSARCFS